MINWLDIVIVFNLGLGFLVGWVTRGGYDAREREGE